MSDLISRQAALNVLCDNCDTVQAVCPHFPCKRYTSVEALPSAQPERKRGKWRYSRNISSISYSDMMITCDQCGYTKERSHGDVFNFCPNCGADMRESHCDDCRFYDEECVYCPVKQERREK